MDQLDRELNRAARKRRKQRVPGMHNEVCIGCAADITHARKEDDHMIGWRSGDVVWPLCVRCHRTREEIKQDNQPPGYNPRNVFEVIGRWLHSVADYFGFMCDTFRRFGDYLIDLAKHGYGAELQFP